MGGKWSVTDKKKNISSTYSFFTFSNCFSRYAISVERFSFFLSKSSSFKSIGRRKQIQTVTNR